MTTRRSTTTRLLATLLTLLAPLAGCDERVRELAWGRAERSERKLAHYTSFLDTDAGRTLALAKLNDGAPAPRDERSERIVAERGLRAGQFVAERPEALALAAPAGERSAPARGAAPDARSLVAALPRAAVADPGLTPALLAILSGQPAQGFVAFAKAAPAGPALFAPEPAPELVLVGQPGGPLPSSPPYDPQDGLGFQDTPPPPPPPNAGIDTISSGTMHLLRYACCEELVVRAEPEAGAPVVATLAQGEAVWLLDLTPSTGLQSAVEELEDCQANGDCHSVVAELASTSAVDYQAEIFVPGQDVAGYVDFAALFVRPVGAAQGEVLLETGFDRIAATLEHGLDEAFQGGTCGDGSNTVTVQAYAHDLHYDPTSKASTSCDDALACPDWKLTDCEGLGSGDEGFDACRYTDVAQCGGPAPAGAASAGKFACVRNVCPGKGTCGACREWFAATGQDASGWQTEQELVAACEAEVLATSDDEDLPLFCLGSNKENCVAACQEHVQAYNVAGCSRYVAAWDSRSYADPTDYECGEVPIAETHPGYWVYGATGEWSGEPDPDWKELESFPLFDQHHVFEMGRLESQTPISFSTPDLSDGGAPHVEQLGSELTARNVWLSLAPTLVDDGVFGWLDGAERSALALNVCAHVPGITVRGPDMDYDPDDTPFFLISHIDFGSGSVDRADLCAMGAATIDDALAPKLAWLDASLALDGIEYGGVEVNKGPGFWLLAASAKLVPFVGEILAGVVLTAVFTEELAEAAINLTDLDSWLADFLLRAYEAKVTGKVLDQLNAETRSALAGLDLDAQERLAQVCEQLDPGVSPSSPYYWFYRHLQAECERVTATAAIDPIVPNQTSEEHGCYGAQMLFTPDDAGEGHWWQQYMWQDWYFPFWEEAGCRIGTKVEAVADPATWPVLRCATAVFNAYANGLVFGPDETTSGLGFLTTDAAPPTEEEEFEALGALGFMVKEACGAVGHQALEALYGDGADVAALWLHNHGATDPALQSE